MPRPEDGTKRTISARLEIIFQLLWPDFSSSSARQARVCCVVALTIRREPVWKLIPGRGGDARVYDVLFVYKRSAALGYGSDIFCSVLFYISFYSPSISIQTSAALPRQLLAIVSLDWS